MYLSQLCNWDRYYGNYGQVEILWVDNETLKYGDRFRFLTVFNKNVHIKKDNLKMLAETGTRVSLSTMKQVLSQH